jgi:hypothetical protein
VCDNVSRLTIYEGQKRVQRRRCGGRPGISGKSICKDYGTKRNCLIPPGVAR